MSLVVQVDLLAPTPVYEQIRSQVSAHVAAGLLGAGDRLPTVRALAAELGLATNTVARAYHELEAEGLVTTRRRVGTVVTRSGPAGEPEPARGTARAELQRCADELAAYADAAGLDEQQVLSVVRGALLRRHRR